MSQEHDLIQTHTPAVRDRASRMADEVIRSSTFVRYQQQLAPHTKRRQRADLALFVLFLTELEHQDAPGSFSPPFLLAYLSLSWLMVAALMNDPRSWEGITYGL